MVACKDCTGRCCKEISVEIDPPKTLEDWDVIRWMVAHENVAVYVDYEGDWLVEFKTPCRELNSGHRCAIYEDRPHVCKDYPLHDCIVNAEEPAKKLRFETIEGVGRHIEETVVPKEKIKN